MKIITAKDYNELSKIAADIIINEVNQNPTAVLGLATGSTPIGTYKEIINTFNQGKVDFSSVKTANLDEYVGLPRDDQNSYFNFMRVNLFNHINIDEKNTNIPDGTNLDAKAECLNYEKTISDLGGIDLQLLGIGHNGHIGFNEPADDFAAITHLVDLDDRTIDANARFFASKDDVPKKAYTMGIGTIMQAKKILLIVKGKDKADILFDTVYGKITPKIPSTVLRLHQDVTIVADCDALSKINALK